MSITDPLSSVANVVVQFKVDLKLNLISFALGFEVMAGKPNTVGFTDLATVVDAEFAHSSCLLVGMAVVDFTVNFDIDLDFKVVAC